MKSGEHRSDLESELALDDPTDLDDMVFSDEEESREVIAISAVRRDPTATSAGEEQEAAQRVAVPALRKHAASADAIGERAVKWTRSPRPSAMRREPSATSVGEEQEATRRAEVPASRKRAVSTDVVGERATKRTPSPRLSAVSPVLSSPAVDAAERAGWSEEQSGACAATGPVPTSDL